MNTYEFGNPKASTVLIQMVDDHDLEVIENEVAEIQKRSETDFHLIARKVKDWNRELSPWSAPAVFGKEGFGDGAASTLEEVLKYCSNPDKRYIIGGYSLAGLFAIWAAYQTDIFVISVGLKLISLAGPDGKGVSVRITAAGSIGGSTGENRKRIPPYSSPVNAGIAGSHLRFTGRMTGSTAAGNIT